MYTNTFILDEINKSRFSELVLPSNEIGVYLIRIRLPYENKYTYKVGTTGPGGGQIFYNAGSVQSWGQYLELAPTSTTIFSLGWCHSAYTSTLIGTSSAIGTGLANTNAILAIDSTSGTPAYYCKNYSNNGKTDWFMPSLDELTALFNAKLAHTLNINTSTIYSSTEFDASNAYNVSGLYYNPYSGFVDKSVITAYKTIAIRAF
jgi:hypothetical protein